MNEPKCVRTVTVTNPEGLHVRPLDLISKRARLFQATIELVDGSNRADAKSIMSLLTMAGSYVQGTQLTVEATGSDAEAAVAALAELFAQNFPE